MARDVDTGQASADLSEHFFRREFGRLVARLTARYGPARVELIEDAVQSALLAALTGWGPKGVPDNPSAWLGRVAHNRLVDQLRRLDRETQGDGELSGEDSPATTGFGREIDDDELRMLFVCCDPAVSERAQLVLSLKLLCGFSTREIAARLFITEENVQKTLSRGRNRLRTVFGRPDGDWDSPPPEALPHRLPAVRSVIYLLFNEGYSSQRDDQVIRRELCDEALRLGQLLVSHACGDDDESWALVALMHFHRARLDARLDESGHVLLLDQQDRSLWDRSEIQRGLAAFLRASTAQRFSRYLGEAAILAEHCTAPTFEATRWHEIVDLYELLERHCGPSPLYILNRAVALAQWKGPEHALAVLEGITPPAWLTRHYLWDATLGELLWRCDRHDAARRHLERALQGAPTSAERAVFERKLARCTP
ncbi:MAG: sigma-70 family RNA polymerase sigma factor [Myxococcales bacterium]|nr:sigma-70 family RNA polymerase sigma factor [Myxococcales bacterium]